MISLQQFSTPQQLFLIVSMVDIGLVGRTKLLQLFSFCLKALLQSVCVQFVIVFWLLYVSLVQPMDTSKTVL